MDWWRWNEKGGRNDKITQKTTSWHSGSKFSATAFLGGGGGVIFYNWTWVKIQFTQRLLKYQVTKTRYRYKYRYGEKQTDRQTDRDRQTETEMRICARQLPFWRIWYYKCIYSEGIWWGGGGGGGGVRLQGKETCHTRKCMSNRSSNQRRLLWFPLFMCLFCLFGYFFACVLLYGWACCLLRREKVSRQAYTLISFSFLWTVMNAVDHLFSFASESDFNMKPF